MPLECWIQPRAQPYGGKQTPVARHGGPAVLQEVEKQYREGTLKAHIVAVLKAVQPEALTTQGRRWLSAAVCWLCACIVNRHCNGLGGSGLSSAWLSGHCFLWGPALV